MTDNNKRNKERVEMGLNVFGPDGKLLGVTKDVSSDGCFLETSQDIVGDSLSISVEMPGKLGMVKMDCKVVRTTKEGIGIKLFMDEKDRIIFTQMQGISVY